MKAEEKQNIKDKKIKMQLEQNKQVSHALKKMLVQLEMQQQIKKAKK
jgi:hypothetical protein